VALLPLLAQAAVGVCLEVSSVDTSIDSLAFAPRLLGGGCFVSAAAIAVAIAAAVASGSGAAVQPPAIKGPPAAAQQPPAALAGSRHLGEF
jgi:hypothetical protein